MSVQHTQTGEECQQLWETENTVLVFKYSAVWCRPCRDMTPIFEKYSQEYPNFKFAEIDVDKCNWSGPTNISSLPTFEFWLNKKLLHSFSGKNEQKLANILQNLK